MKPLLTIVILSLLFSSCMRKPNTSDIIASLTGTWQEEETEPSFAGTTHRFEFGPDATFKLRIQNYTDAIDPNNPCSNYTSYVVGNYEAGSYISLRGQYCDSTFTIIRPNSCTGDTTYYKYSSYTFQDGKLIFDKLARASVKIVMHRE